MTVTIDINENIQKKNNEYAALNRQAFSSYRVFNMIGSPGAGKTAILERTAGILGDELAIIEGDVKTDLDAQRIISFGSQSIQIETGGGCHLNAEMVKDAVDRLDLSRVRIIVIENVGNLVCPSAYDLGEDAKVAVISLPEGDEKPRKYPALFMRVDLVLINKVDLRDVLAEYDLDRVREDCLKINPSVRVLEISAKTGKGFDEWMEYLTKEK